MRNLYKMILITVIIILEFSFMECSNSSVEDPIFDLAPGTYKQTQKLTISSNTPDSWIRYTLDGTEPTAKTGNIYSGSINIDKDIVVKAIAYKKGMNNSKIISAEYKIFANVEKPIFSIDGGVYNQKQIVSIKSETTDAEIKYTLDGTEPKKNLGLTYSKPINIDRNLIIKAIAFKKNMKESEIVTVEYKIKASPPITNIPKGLYNSTQEVVLSTKTNDAEIIYTLDGTEPTKENSTIYSKPILIDKTTTITMITKKEGLVSSDVVSVEYKIKANNPIFSVPSGVYEKSQEVLLSTKTNDAEIIYTLDGTEPTKENGIVYSEPILIDKKTIIRAIVLKEGLINSNIIDNNYIFKVSQIICEPPEGLFTEAQTITMSTKTDDAEIIYTLDGTEPTKENGTIYLEPILIENPTTINIIAYKKDFDNSDLLSLRYDIKAIKPICKPQTGGYISSQTVTMSTETDGAEIIYTLDGTEPTKENGTIYLEPIVINKTSILKAIAVKDGINNSDIMLAEYKIKAEEPVFSNQSGIYENFIELTMNTNTQDATIYYTLDGIEPTDDSNIFKEPIKLESSFRNIAPIIVKAYTAKEGLSNSDIASAEYIINSKYSSAKITLPDDSDVKFGFSSDVSSDGNLIIIGAIGSSDDIAGCVYIYTWNAENLSWEYNKIIGETNKFGYKVQLSSNNNTITINDTNYSYVYKLNSKNKWINTNKAASNEIFEYKNNISLISYDGTLMVTSSSGNTDNVGEISFYKWNVETNDWEIINKYTYSNDAVINTLSIAENNSTVVMGINENSNDVIYVYDF